MNADITREQALGLLREHNKEPFHVLHVLTVEGAVRQYMKEPGHGDDEDLWGIAGLLHDVDFEPCPEEHCAKAPELLKLTGASDKLIHAVYCHGYGICSDVEPVHEMGKVLFASDELTGLIGAVARIRPSKSVVDMEVSSLKKKFKDKRFAARCSRDMTVGGAEKLDWTLGELVEKTILAIRSCEERIQDEIDNL